MQLLVGTNNAGKFIEISEVLAPVGLRLLKPEDLGICSNPDETGNTFAANAELKARYFFDESQKARDGRKKGRDDRPIPTIADDSGIVVEALRDELGVFTRRWGAGPAASDEEWIDFFLKRMSEEKNKRARFLCVVAHINEDGQLQLFEGSCEGEITEQLEADYLPGLPISGCFRPDGYNCVFSALRIEQKNCTSHRGRAAQKLKEFLEQKSC